MKKLKILMVIAVFYPYTGGAEKQAEKLAIELLNRGIDVTVITGRWSNLLKKHEDHRGIKIIRNITNFLLYEKTFNPDISFFRDYEKKDFNTTVRKIFVRSCVYVYQISLFFRLLTLCKNFDVIHVHQVLYPAFVSAFAGRILKKPVIAKVGSSGFNSDINQIRKLPGGRLQLKYILKNLDVLVCTSRLMREEFAGEGMAEDRIRIIRNGVEFTRFSRSYNKCKKLVYLGRFIKSKGIETLITAFREIIKYHKGLKLTLIGDGPEKDNIKNMVEKQGLKDSIVFTGMISDPGRILRESDLFVFPSLIEGISNSLIEAMSLALPCVVTAIPGNIEVLGKGQDYKIEKGSFIELESGILFNPEDDIGLLNAASYLIGNRNARERIGKGAFKRVMDEFNIKKVADNYLELYREVIRQ